jgi:hypothetical protein
MFLTMASVAVVAAQNETDRPESVIRAYVLAMVSNDVAAYEKLTVPDPRRTKLTQGGRVNEEARQELRQNPEAVQMRIARPFLHQGRTVKPDARGQYPVGTTVRYSVSYRRPMVVTLVRKDDGWKVDVRWWLAMMDLATNGPEREGTPGYAARRLVLSLVSLDRKAAAEFVAPGADIRLLFDGAPSQREPSGVLEASAMEMPLVEIGPGDFAELPSGRVVEGSSSADTKVLVGLFGPVEVPFVVHRAGQEWRVDAEPYFALLNR